MYDVSEAYLAAIHAQNVVCDWYGTIKAKNGVMYYITPKEMSRSKAKVTRQICTNTDIKIGTTCSSELMMDLYLEHVSRYELMDAECKLWYRVQLEDKTWEEVPLGVFYVTEPPERNVDIITVTAYDAMMKFNLDFGRTIQGLPYNMLVWACEVCGVELGTSQEYIANCPNGQVETYNLQDVQIYTYRDLIGYLASYLCCYAYIGVDGKLYVHQYDMTAIRTIDENWRYNYKPKDYECFYSSLSAYFVVTQEYEQVVLNKTGLDYDLQTHPFIQFNADEVRRGCLTNIITRLAEVHYTPFTAKTPCDPSLMVGDVLNFTGNHAVDGKLAAITKQVITVGGSMELSCVGSDPNLNVKTETEKRIANAAKNSNKDGMYYYDFVNVDELEIGDGKQAIVIVFNYVTTKETHVNFHAELKCHVDTTETYDEGADTYTENDGKMLVTYRSGGDIVTEYYPVDSDFDGIKLNHLFYSWWASGNIVSTFEVLIKCVGCSVTIEKGSARGCIEGVGLVGDVAWDGSVYIYEEFPPYDFGRLHKQLVDTVSTAFITPDTGSVTQNKRKLNFFKTIVKTLHESLVENGLHRFSVPYNDNQVVKTGIITTGNVWKNEDTTVDGTVTTLNCTVERILKVTSNRTPNSGDVTYLVSFDDGESWYTYADGFVPYVSDYGMVAGTLAAITEAEWAEMIADTGTIKVRATLQGDSTLTDIQIFTYETTSWISQGPEAASSFDSRYVTNAGEQVELITKGYTYTGTAQSVDSGNESRVLIDTSTFSDVRKVDVKDQYDNLLSEAQRDMNNWSSGLAGWSRTVNYQDGVNILSFLTISGWEDLVVAVEVEPNTNYELSFLYNSTTGYTGSGNSRRAFIWAQDWVYTNEDRSLTDYRLLGYTDVWGTGASELPVQYTKQFNSGENHTIKIEFTFGGMNDNQRATMLFHSIKLRKV